MTNATLEGTKLKRTEDYVISLVDRSKTNHFDLHFLALLFSSHRNDLKYKNGNSSIDPIEVKNVRSERRGRKE